MIISKKTTKTIGNYRGVLMDVNFSKEVTVWYFLGIPIYKSTVQIAG